MKGWQILLIILAAIFVVGGLLGSFDETSIEEPATTKTEQSAPAKEEVEEVEEVEEIEEVEEVPIAPVEESKPIVDIYNTIQLDMTENEVVALVGEPDSTNEVNIEGFGKSKDLDYNGWDYDSVTITVDNGLVTAVTLAEWDGDDLNLVSKNK